MKNAPKNSGGGKTTTTKADASRVQSAAARQGGVEKGSQAARMQSAADRQPPK